MHSPQENEGKKEFLIPVESESGVVLVGLKTGNEYKQDMVVYTVKELTPGILEEKAKELDIKTNAILFESYLSQMPNFKISKMVAIKSNGEFCLEYVSTYKNTHINASHLTSALKRLRK